MDNKQPRDGALLVDPIENDADTELQREIAAVDAKKDGIEPGAGHGGDGKAEESAEMLDEIFDIMDLDVDVNIREDEERIVLDVVGPDAGRVIGKKGQTLDALQFLLNKALNRFPEGRRHIIIDSGDYRERHDRNLVSLARHKAKQAVQSGRTVTLEPMPPRDRRVIHLSLAKFEGVTTESQGAGARRRIQIIPQRRR